MKIISKSGFYQLVADDEAIILSLEYAGCVGNNADLEIPGEVAQFWLDLTTHTFGFDIQPAIVAGSGMLADTILELPLAKLPTPDQAKQWVDANSADILAVFRGTPVKREGHTLRTDMSEEAAAIWSRLGESLAQLTK